MPELIEEILCLVDIKQNTVSIMPTMTSPAKFVDAGEAIQFKRLSGKVTIDRSHQIDHIMELHDETQIDFDNS